MGVVNDGVWCLDLNELGCRVEGHAKLLEKDGLIINYSKKTPVVKNYESYVVDVT